MDFEKLVDEIIKRVTEKMQAGEGTAAAPCTVEQKPKLLILTQEHGTVCHEMLESKRLLEYYDTGCALLQDYAVEIDVYEAVILFDLTIDALTRLTGGVCDTPFTALAQKAILKGRKIFVPEEAVELFQYAETAPAAYYQMLKDKLELLRQSGVIICPMASLEDAILSGEVEPHTAQPTGCPREAARPSSAPVAAEPVGHTATLSKRVITERDINAVYDRTLRAIYVDARSIVTDLAQDYAQARNVAILRSE